MSRNKRLTTYYRELGDDALVDAHSAGPAAYDAVAWSVIVAEVAARGLAVAPVPSPNLASSPPPLPDEDWQREQFHAELRTAERVSQRGTAYLILGLLVTFGTYVMTSSGYYIIAWGAVVYGVLEIRRGAQIQDRVAKARQALDQSNIDARPSNVRTGR